MSIFLEYTKKHFKSNFSLAVVVILESKGLSFSTGQLSGPTFWSNFQRGFHAADANILSE